MDHDFLKDLGVDEKIAQAIKNNYGDCLDELEIFPDRADLKLILRGPNTTSLKPRILTIHDFFENKVSPQVCEGTDGYHVEKYKCRDIVELFPYASPGEANLRLNGENVMLGEALYKLLFHLAQELGKTQTGWVYLQDLQSSGIVRSDGYQPFSRLRSALSGYLLKKNPRDFIESSGQKQYRLSANPKNIFIHNGAGE